MSDPTPPPPGWGQPQGPGQPGSGQPGQPGFGQPGPPGFGQPGQPGFGQPGQGQPPAPGFGQPSQPPPPPPQQGAPAPGFGAPPGFGPQDQPGQFQPGQYPQAYGQPPSGGGGNRTAIIVAVVVVAVVVLGGALLAVLLARGNDGGAVVESVTASASALDEAVADLGSELDDPLSGLAGTPGATPTPDVAQEESSVFDLQQGDCFNQGQTSDEVQTVGVVPCETLHDSEVFHLVDFPATDDAFPGLEALNNFADDECQGQAFTDYVGVAWAESRYFTSQLTPTERSWEQGDREIVCLLYDPTTQLDRSVRGSAQ